MATETNTKIPVDSFKNMINTPNYSQIEFDRVELESNVDNVKLSNVNTKDKSNDSLYNAKANQAYRKSPALSIRSKDSSIINSDSEVEAEAEGVKSVIEKIPGRTTYASNTKKILDIDKHATLLNEKLFLDGPTIPSQALNGAINGFVGEQIKTPTTTQIGSIAVSNSSDVTFGNKHFYEGPVTIQQFLIKNPAKPANIEHLTAVNITNNNNNNNNNETGKLNKTPSNSFNGLICSGLTNLGKYMIVGIICVLILLTVTAIFGKGLFISKSQSYDLLENVSTTPASMHNFETYMSSQKGVIYNVDNSTIEPCPNGTLCIIKRLQWHARAIPLGTFISLNLPVERVIISHTVTEICFSFNECAITVQLIQNFHMDEWHFSHIGYNFLIGGDGRVYEGRGWNMMGAHTKNANTNSLGVSFIGNFIDDTPTDSQLLACDLLLKEGVRLKKITPNYKLYGARQLTLTQSPGDALYEIIQTWPHWSNDSQISA